jgi:hypothetical protein
MAGRVWQAALTLIGAAVLARVAYELLQPLLPALACIAVLAGVIGLVIRPRRFDR